MKLAFRGLPTAFLGIGLALILLHAFGRQTLGQDSREKGSQDPPGAKPPQTGLEFIDTSFENASPLWYETDANGTIRVHLQYDHERSSPNRAAGHFHFQVQAKPGSQLTLEFNNLDNVWNG